MKLPYEGMAFDEVLALARADFDRGCMAVFAPEHNSPWTLESHESSSYWLGYRQGLLALFRGPDWVLSNQ